MLKSKPVRNTTCRMIFIALFAALLYHLMWGAITKWISWKPPEEVYALDGYSAGITGIVTVCSMLVFAVPKLLLVMAIAGPKPAPAEHSMEMYIAEVGGTVLFGILCACLYGITRLLRSRERRRPPFCVPAIVLGAVLFCLITAALAHMECLARAMPDLRAAASAQRPIVAIWTIPMIEGALNGGIFLWPLSYCMAWSFGLTALAHVAWRVHRQRARITE